jgi:hypothetical protein
MESITIYNHYRDPCTGAEGWLRTVISGRRDNGLGAVLWEDSRAANIVDTGLANADRVNIFIWFCADAQGKQYISPKRFAALPPDQAAEYWTLQTGEDRVIKGVAEEEIPPYTINDVVKRYDDIVTVSSVDRLDYGSAHTRHWEVGGK